MSRRGTVFLAEQEETSEFGLVFTGRFHGYHDHGRGEGEDVDSITDADADAAIAWGRARAERVWIRLVDGPYYAAGTGHDPGAPRWPDGRVIRRRRPAGQEWRDRGASDPPIAWTVYVDIAVFAHEPLEEPDAIIADMARVAGACDWARGEVQLEGGTTDGGWFGTTHFARMPEGDPGGWTMRAPSGRPLPDGFIGYGDQYRLRFELSAPTAAEAMAAAVARCTDPRWSTGAMARPASDRAAG